jgi:hypothetical protein
LYVEANEPSLENRRIRLGMQYELKVGFGFNHGGFSGITIG